MTIDLSPKLSLPSFDEEVKDSVKATNDLLKQVVKNQYRRKSLKLQRIATFKVNKFQHALDMIIERVKYQNTSNVAVSLEELLFEDADVDTFLGWLNNIKAFGGFKHYSKQSYVGNVRFYLIGTNLKKLEQFKDQKDLLPSSVNEPSKFLVYVKDREIRINEYLIAKPHAVGNNYEFFVEHIRSKPAGSVIRRKDLDVSLQERVKNKSFIKILNELGFKGEILKAFFNKRGKDSLVYMGDKVTRKDLEKSGIKIPTFLLELQLANEKISS